MAEGGTDLSLHLVTDRALCGGRGVPATVAAAVHGGVSVVQLRDKDATAREAVALAEELLRLLAGTGVPLVVDDRLDVALAVGAAGVHLGQSDLPVEHARRLGGPGFLVGLSASTPVELEAAAALPAGTVDYLGVGPVFTTATKPSAPPGIGLETTAELVSGTALSCVGIGGIDPGNAAAVWATGLDGLAVVSALCAAPDPAAAAAELLAARRRVPR